MFLVSQRATALARIGAADQGARLGVNENHVRAAEALRIAADDLVASARQFFFHRLAYVRLHANFQSFDVIGRNAAVARIWGLSFSGFVAWVIWVGLHIFRIIGFRNRLLVMINWAWDYFFYENQVWLITKE